MEWEDKHLFRRASEHKHLYSQGVKDGIQLIIALLNICLIGRYELNPNDMITRVRSGSPYS